MTSGMTSGTAGSIRAVRVLLTTRWPAAANAGSISVGDRRVERREHQPRPLARACRPAPACAGPRRAAACRAARSTASRVGLALGAPARRQPGRLEPRMRSRAARMNCCPTIPVAPRIPTSIGCCGACSAVPMMPAYSRKITRVKKKPADRLLGQRVRMSVYLRMFGAGSFTSADAHTPPTCRVA